MLFDNGFWDFRINLLLTVTSFTSFYQFFFKLEMLMKFINFVNSLLETLIPPEIHVQIAISLSIFDGLQQWRVQNLSQTL